MYQELDGLLGFESHAAYVLQVGVLVTRQGLGTRQGFRWTEWAHPLSPSKTSGVFCPLTSVKRCVLSIRVLGFDSHAAYVLQAHLRKSND